MSAAYIMGELCDERAITPLMNAIENHDLKITANEQLVKFGPMVVPEVIKRVEYRIANPIKEGIGASNMTGSALLTIGEIQCDESVEFLNKLLDEYIFEDDDDEDGKTEVKTIKKKKKSKRSTKRKTKTKSQGK